MTDRTGSSILLAVIVCFWVPGCYTWQRIPLTREALEQEDLLSCTVRIIIGDSSRVMYLQGVHFPDPCGGINGAYVTGLEHGTPVIVPLEDMTAFEISEFSGKKMVEAGGRVVVFCIILFVGAFAGHYGVPLEV